MSTYLALMYLTKSHMCRQLLLAPSPKLKSENLFSSSSRCVQFGPNSCCRREIVALLEKWFLYQTMDLVTMDMGLDHLSTICAI